MRYCSSIEGNVSREDDLATVSHTPRPLALQGTEQL